MAKRIDWRGQRQVTRVPFPSPYAIIDFPPNPVIGDQFLAPNGSTYEWDGTVWIGVFIDIPSGSVVPIDPNPPLNAMPGQLWWRSDPDGVLYVLYNDGNSTQWVPAMPPNVGNAGIQDAPNDGNTYGRQNGAWVIIP
jgi:hypothetical protein